ncbi:hypothetical protein Pyn_30034 [Prunus yedoensis var. nudiflora]|uniref:Uncharacterized protein n=1 Tax=Prunus yedoensis var. nudiflora TaxID=2094558 RepID=A0A314ZKI2_PRUYE|nr:hypothetical protein Pyn_30034 [Prunus yedoensis var. nudiflora]
MFCTRVYLLWELPKSELCEDIIFQLIVHDVEENEEQGENYDQIGINDQRGFMDERGCDDQRVGDRGVREANGDQRGGGGGNSDQRGFGDERSRDE